MTDKIIEAAHWRDVPKAQWPWRHFAPHEMADPQTGEIKVAVALMDQLDALRAAIGKPLHITSGYRSPEHNRAVEGKKGSKHLLGQAADISMVGHDPKQFYETAQDAGFLGFGFYPTQRFMHIDLGPKRWWGEPKPWGINLSRVKQALVSRSAGGTLVAIGAAAQPVVENLPDVDTLAQAGEALTGAGYSLQPLLEYLPSVQTLQIVFALVMVAGVALTVWAQLRRGGGKRRRK